jgi:TRAP-type mannitol/chloroaromatic compound transport system substrate-binding protein
MKRRDFVRKATVGLAGGTVLAGCNSSEDEGGAAAVQTRPRVNWRLVSSFPRSLDTIYGAAEVLADRVSNLTNGRFTIRAFPAGEIVPYDQILESVQKGTVPLGHTASYYYIGVNPALAFDCTVPFGMTVRQLNSWMYYGEGKNLTRDLFSEFNILNYPLGNTGTQMGGWFRNQVRSLADLKGLKMRIPGLGGKVMDRMGVTVQVLAGGEIYSALERGAIDATEWSGPYDDEKLGFYQVAKNYYYPGWWEPGPGLSLYVNRDAWEKLPSDYKAALEVAAAESNVGMMANYDAANPPALSRLVDRGVKLRKFSDDIMTEARRLSLELMDEEAAANQQYNRIYQSYRKWQASSNAWFHTAEQAYADFSFQSG